MTCGKARLLQLAVFALMTANLSGCRQLLDDFRMREAEAGTDGGDRDPCNELGYPPPPRSGHSSSHDSVAFIVALETVDAGDSSQSDPRIGYNIDRICTRSVDTRRCVPPDPLVVTIDGPDGIDNSLGQLVSHWFTEPKITMGLQTNEMYGINAYLLQITGYNGQPDDPEVSAAMISGTTREADETGTKPSWQGADVWKPFATWVSGASPPAPTHFAERAYVTGGILVAEFSALPLSGAPDEPAMFGNVFTGEVKESSGRYYLKNGMRAGRWALPGVLGFLAYIDKVSHNWPDPNDCTFPNDSTYPGDAGSMYPDYKINACGAADIRTEDDNHQLPCDALSIGMKIEGIPARLGQVEPVPNPTGLCEIDSCATLFGSAGAN